MSKMHSKGRGSSGSKKPLDAQKPDWVDYDKEEVTDLVLKLREQGLQPAQIGLQLRDQYGIPSVEQITDKTVTEILEENNASLDIPEDLQNLVDKAEAIQDHMEDNPEDSQAERRLGLTEAKIRRIAQYHRDNGNIDQDWKYRRR